jgi:hypothetical protein
MLTRPFKVTAASQEELVSELRALLERIRRCCRTSTDPIVPMRYALWPQRNLLTRLSDNIQNLAAKLRRGRKTLWSCIEAIDDRVPSLKLGKSITGMVSRAAELYQQQENRPIKDSETSTWWKHSGRRLLS